MKHNLEKKFSNFDLALILALVVILLINIVVVGNLRGPGERKASRDAVTVTGSAPGKEGDVTVQVVADADNIYSVTVTAQNETPSPTRSSSPGSPSMRCLTPVAMITAFAS